MVGVWIITDTIPSVPVTVVVWGRSPVPAAVVKTVDSTPGAAVVGVWIMTETIPLVPVTVAVAGREPVPGIVVKTVGSCPAEVMGV